MTAADRAPGRAQRRRRARLPADQGPGAAVRVVRRLGDDRSRSPRSASCSRSRARRDDAVGAARRPDRRRRHGRPRLPRPRARRGARRARRSASRSSARPTGIEARVVPAAGYPLHLVPGRQLRGGGARGLARGAVAGARGVGGALGAACDGSGRALVVGVGGYASVAGGAGGAAAPRADRAARAERDPRRGQPAASGGSPDGSASASPRRRRFFPPGALGPHRQPGPRRACWRRRTRRPRRGPGC